MSLLRACRFARWFSRKEHCVYHVCRMQGPEIYYFHKGRVLSSELLVRQYADGVRIT